MIRESIKFKVYNRLNYDIFRIDDFVIKEELKDKLYLISIRKDQFYFIIKMNVSNNNVWVSYLPGNILNEESEEIKIYEFETLVMRLIREWLDRVKTELVSSIQYRYIDNTIEQFIDEINIKLEDIEDTYFSRSEGEELAIRLEQLEKLLTQREDNDDNIGLLNELEKMKNEIKFLKDTIYNTTKRKWFKSTLLKMRAWSKDPQNKELIMMGMEGVKAISQLDLPSIKS